MRGSPAAEAASTNVELAGLLLTLLTAVGAGSWAVWTWRAQRRKDREEELKRLASLYVMPFLLACEDLQSRLYNILCLGGLGPCCGHGTATPMRWTISPQGPGSGSQRSRAS